MSYKPNDLIDRRFMRDAFTPSERRLMAGADKSQVIADAIVIISRYARTPEDVPRVVDYIVEHHEELKRDSGGLAQWEVKLLGITMAISIIFDPNGQNKAIGDQIMRLAGLSKIGSHQLGRMAQ